MWKKKLFRSKSNKKLQFVDHAVSDGTCEYSAPCKQPFLKMWMILQFNWNCFIFLRLGKGDNLKTILHVKWKISHYPLCGCIVTGVICGRGGPCLKTQLLTIPFHSTLSSVCQISKNEHSGTWIFPTESKAFLSYNYLCLIMRRLVWGCSWLRGKYNHLCRSQK